MLNLNRTSAESLNFDGSLRPRLPQSLRTGITDKRGVLAPEDAADEFLPPNLQALHESLRRKRITVDGSADLLAENATGPSSKRSYRVVKIVRRLKNQHASVQPKRRLDQPVQQDYDPAAIPAAAEAVKGAFLKTEDDYGRKTRMRTVVRVVPLRSLSAVSSRTDGSDLSGHSMVRTKTTQSKLRRVKVVKRKRRPDGSAGRLPIPANRDDDGWTTVVDEGTLLYAKGQPDKRFLAEEGSEKEKVESAVNMIADDKAFVEGTARFKALTEEQSENYRHFSEDLAKMLAKSRKHDAPETIPTESDAKTSHFVEQFESLKRTALCVTRVLLDAWCIVQFAAVAPFLMGILTRSKWYLMPHLILDALFLLLLFIYGITVTVFGLMLFVFVDEMTLRTLACWLLFAGALDLLFAAYAIMFTLTLRCCDILQNAGEKLRHHFGNHEQKDIGDTQSSSHLIMANTIDSGSMSSRQMAIL